MTICAKDSMKDAFPAEAEGSKDEFLSNVQRGGYEGKVQSQCFTNV